MARWRHIPALDAAFAPVDRCRGVEMAVLIGESPAAPNFAMRRFRVAPGGRIPEHRHADIEHEQLLLTGELTLALNGEQIVARAGDAILIPAGVAHWYENRGGTPVEFLCLVPHGPMAPQRVPVEWLEPPLENV